ncbi:MAG: glycosyltransferase family 4 protein [Chitinispirillaceae bacterium]
MKPIRVLMIIDRYHPVWGGAENQLKQLLPHFRAHGIDCSVVTRRWKKTWRKKDVFDATPVTRLGAAGVTKLHDVLYAFHLFVYLLFRTDSYTCFHSHGAILLGALTTLAARLRGKKSVVKIASSTKIPALRRRLAGKLLLQVCRLSSTIVAVSNEIRAELHDAGIDQKRIALIPNGVDHRRFAPATTYERFAFRKAHGLDRNHIIAVFCSRLVRGKGIEVLMDAWKLVEQNRSLNATLFILGDDYMQNNAVAHEIRGYASHHLKHVRFEGAVKRPEVYLNHADLFIFPSQREGCPNALLEAMAGENTCIASRIGGNIDLIDNECGLLFEPDDAEQCADQIIKVLSHMRQYRPKAAAARKKVYRHNSFQKISSQYNTLYRELLK